eukprot:TRINITY_DN73487_c0_g1_i1.p1 TRINITY_DN73487_c0_g1~~TRINITY_DN73487_c0_g1_i1.p1  ORF type:complete len:360 (-),score=40.62 TRINITY_DN73487_c0_g1_i1:179-1258(-)
MKCLLGILLLGSCSTSRRDGKPRTNQELATPLLEGMPSGMRSRSSQKSTQPPPSAAVQSRPLRSSRTSGEVQSRPSPPSSDDPAAGPFEGDWAEISNELKRSGEPWNRFVYAAFASAAAYEDGDGPMHSFLRERHFVKAASFHGRLQVWLPDMRACRSPMVLVALRGSIDSNDALVDVKLTGWGIAGTKRYKEDRVALQKVFEQQRATFEEFKRQYPELPFIVTGHSLGAALAADVYFGSKYGDPYTHCVVFNKPYVADHDRHTSALEALREAAKHYFIFDKSYDIVSSLKDINSEPAGSHWMYLKHQNSIQENEGYSRFNLFSNHGIDVWLKYLCDEAPKNILTGCGLPEQKSSKKRE